MSTSQRSNKKIQNKYPTFLHILQLFGDERNK
jgi:hypothetical protein